MSVGEVKEAIGALLNQVEQHRTTAFAAYYEMNDAMLATMPFLGHDDTEGTGYSDRVFACLNKMYEGLSQVEGAAADFRGYVQQK